MMTLFVMMAAGMMSVVATMLLIARSEASAESLAGHSMPVASTTCAAHVTCVTLGAAPCLYTAATAGRRLEAVRAEREQFAHAA